MTPMSPRMRVTHFNASVSLEDSFVEKMAVLVSDNLKSSNLSSVAYAN